MWNEKLYEKYRAEFAPRSGEILLTAAEFDKRFGEKRQHMESVEIENEGVLFYRTWEEDDRQVCVIPSWGYYASSEKMLIRLFSRLSEKLLARNSTRFEAHFYAHDAEAQRTFAMMQFGYQAETGIFPVGQSVLRADPAVTIRTLAKEEISAEWGAIWLMTSSILRHLQSAPVFYPCREFSEEGYREFFLDGETHLHVAYDNTGNPIGMIETNEEESSVLGVRSANVGEIYVLPDRRGSGLSDALLAGAASFEAARGVRYLWVEHGTANPNAREFWGRYFDSYEYEMDRFIEQFLSPIR